MASTAFTATNSSTKPIRTICAVLAAIVLIDAAVVQAPGLALLALPYLIGALTFTRGRRVSTVVLLVWALFYVAIGVNFIVATGFDAGWGDLLFAYPGTVAAVVLTGLLVRHLFGARPAVS